MTREEIGIQKDRIGRAEKLVRNINEINEILASMYDGCEMGLGIWSGSRHECAIEPSSTCSNGNLHPILGEKWYIDITDPKIGSHVNVMLLNLKRVYEEELEAI